MLWQARAALSHCIRISPTHGDFGGFFCALFEKVAPGPATLPPRLLDSTEGSKATGMKRDKEVKDGKGTKGTNPIPSLLAAPNGAQLQWLVEWFGLLSDEEEAWDILRMLGCLASNAAATCFDLLPLLAADRLPNLVFSVSHWNWFAMIQIWKESRLQMLLWCHADLCSVGLNLQSSTPAPLQEKGICDVLWSDVEWTDIYVARIIKIEEHRRPYHLQDGLIISSQSLCRNLTATMLPFALGKPNMNKIHRYTNIVQDQPISHPHTQKIQRPPRAETCPSPGCWLPACLFLQMRLKSLNIRSLIKTVEILRWEEMQLEQLWG